MFITVSSAGSLPDMHCVLEDARLSVASEDSHCIGFYYASIDVLSMVVPLFASECLASWAENIVAKIVIAASNDTFKAILLPVIPKCSQHSEPFTGASVARAAALPQSR